MGLDDMRGAVTDDSIDGLGVMIAEMRKSFEEWDNFLGCVAYDNAMKVIKAR